MNKRYIVKKGSFGGSAMYQRYHWKKVKEFKSLIDAKNYVVEKVGTNYDSEPSLDFKEGFFGIKGEDHWSYKIEVKHHKIKK